MPAVPVANNAAGILNQSLILKELMPPDALITREGYIAAFAIPVFALAIVSSSSLLLISGLFCSNVEGMPLARASGNTTSLMLPFLLTADGATEANILKAFS